MKVTVFGGLATLAVGTTCRQARRPTPSGERGTGTLPSPSAASLGVRSERNRAMVPLLSEFRRAPGLPAGRTIHDSSRRSGRPAAVYPREQPSAFPASCRPPRRARMAEGASHDDRGVRGSQRHDPPPAPGDGLRGRRCPNIHECWAREKTATFMLPGTSARGIAASARSGTGSRAPSSRASPTAAPMPWPSSGWPTRSSPPSTATTSPTVALPISPRPSAPSGGGRRAAPSRS